MDNIIQSQIVNVVATASLNQQMGFEELRALEKSFMILTYMAVESARSGT